MTKKKPTPAFPWTEVVPFGADGGEGVPWDYETPKSPEVKLTALQRYNLLVDALRNQRGVDGWKEEDDRELLEELCLLFDELTPGEQEQVNREGWRSWPDLYDQKMEDFLVENPLFAQGGPVRILKDS